MDAGQEQQPAAHSASDPGRAEVDQAARGRKKLTVDQQRSAIEYLLGTPKPAAYEVAVEYETPEGMMTLTFHFLALDGRVIDKIETRNISEKTGIMDKITADAELVMEAVTEIVDAGGGKTVPRDERFRTLVEGESPLASGTDALLARFGTQVGLLAGVASAIREAAGWNRDRVGKASRLLVDAAGN